MTFRPNEVERPNNKSNTLVDLHVFIFPKDLWLESTRKARNSSIFESISAGFIRVPSTMNLDSIRIAIPDQIGNDVIPEEYVFLKSIGRCLSIVHLSQECTLTAADYVTAHAHSELILLPKKRTLGALTIHNGTTITDHMSNTGPSDMLKSYSSLVVTPKRRIRTNTDTTIDEHNYVHFPNMLILPPSRKYTMSPSPVKMDMFGGSVPVLPAISTVDGMSSMSNIISQTSSSTLVSKNGVSVSGNGVRVSSVTNIQLADDLDLTSFRERIAQRIEAENQRLGKDTVPSNTNDTRPLEKMSVRKRHDNDTTTQQAVDVNHNVKENSNLDTTFNVLDRNNTLDRTNEMYDDTEQSFDLEESFEAQEIHDTRRIRATSNDEREKEYLKVLNIPEILISEESFVWILEDDDDVMTSTSTVSLCDDESEVTSENIACCHESAMMEDIVNVTLSFQTLVDTKESTDQIVEDTKEQSFLKNAKDTSFQTLEDTMEPSTQTVEDTKEPSIQTVEDTKEPSIQTVEDTMKPSIQTVEDTKEPSIQTVEDTKENSYEASLQTVENADEIHKGTEKSCDNTTVPSNGEIYGMANLVPEMYRSVRHPNEGIHGRSKSAYNCNTRVKGTSKSARNSNKNTNGNYIQREEKNATNSVRKSTSIGKDSNSNHLNEIEELKRKIEIVKNEREIFERTMDRLTEKRLEILSEIKCEEMFNDKAWEEKYTEEETRTSHLLTEINKIEKLVRKAEATKESRNNKKRTKSFDGPSERSNQKRRVQRLNNDIHRLKGRYEIVRKQLTEESAMKQFVEEELRNLRTKKSYV